MHDMELDNAVSKRVSGTNARHPFFALNFPLERKRVELAASKTGKTGYLCFNDTHCFLC